MDKPEDLLLDVQHLHTGFRLGDDYYDAVDDVSITLRKDEILAIVGESGSGKSTLATSIIGLHDPRNTKVTGDILYNNLNLVGLNEALFDRIRGKDIGMIFQDPLAALNPLMRIGEQIEETLVYHTKMNKEERESRVLELLNQVGIPNPERTARSYPHELSGGMRQRIVIAIAIACKPPIIIADEPTTALDVTIQAQILDLLEDIQREMHSGIILITHDLGVVASICDRIAIMYGGKIVETGTVFEIFEHPQHPYTIGLLSCISNPNELEKKELHPIPGSPPDLLNIQENCPFADRCASAMKICKLHMPQETQISATHRCSCWLQHPKACKGGEVQ